jgi:hypothetical protein
MPPAIASAMFGFSTIAFTDLTQYARAIALSYPTGKD